jgi:hypothetical protein
MGTGGSFPGGEAAVAWSWPLTFSQCRGQENVDLYIHSPIHLHGGTPLPCHDFIAESGFTRAWLYLYRFLEHIFFLFFRIHFALFFMSLWYLYTLSTDFNRTLMKLHVSQGTYVFNNFSTKLLCLLRYFSHRELRLYLGLNPDTEWRISIWTFLNCIEMPSRKVLYRLSFWKARRHRRGRSIWSRSLAIEVEPRLLLQGCR